MTDDLADARLEREIQKTQEDLDALWASHPITDPNRIKISSLLRKLLSLHESRSEAQIKRMERDRGLE